MNIVTKISALLLAATALTGCKGGNKEYNELIKHGQVHDAQIYEIDSIKNQCKYRFVVNGEEYYGHCQQQPDSLKPFAINDLILVIYLERDPTISRRLSDK